MTTILHSTQKNNIIIPSILQNQKQKRFLYSILLISHLTIFHSTIAFTPIFPNTYNNKVPTYSTNSKGLSSPTKTTTTTSIFSSKSKKNEAILSTKTETPKFALKNRNNNIYHAQRNTRKKQPQQPSKYATFTFKNRKALKWIIQSIEKYLQHNSTTTSNRNGGVLVDYLWSVQQSNTHADRYKILSCSNSTNEILAIIETDTSACIQERCIKFFSKIHCLDLSIPLYKHFLSQGKIPSSQSYIELFMSLRMMKQYDLLERCWFDLLHVVNGTSSSKKEKIAVAGFHVYVNALCESGNVVKAMDIAKRNPYSDAIEEGGSPSIYTFNIVLKSLSSHQHENLDAFDSFYQYIKASTLIPDVYTYNALLRRYTSTNNNGRIVLEIIDTMKENHIPLNAYSIDLSLLSILKYQSSPDMEYILSLVQEYLFKKEPRVISSALEAFLVRLIHTTTTTHNREEEKKVIAAAFFLFNHIVSNTNIVPTLRHYNLLLEGYRRLIQYHIHQFTTITSCASSLMQEEECELEKLQEQEELFQRIQTCRQKAITLLSTNITSPDEYTCTSFMEILSLSSSIHNYKHQHLEQEMNTWVKYFILQKKISINRIVLHSILKAYGTIDRIDIALYVFDMVRRHIILQKNTHVDSSSSYSKRKAFFLSTASYNTLFMILSQQQEGGHDSTDALFDFSKMTLFLEDDPNQTYSSMSESILPSIQNKTTKETALYLLTLMKNNDTTTIPNTQSYCLVATSIANSCPDYDTSIQKAKELYVQALEQDNYIPDGRFINAILRCFADDIISAMLFWKNDVGNSIRSQPLQPQTNLHLLQSYHGLLYVCGRAQRPDIALRILYAMKKEGLEHKEISLKCYESGKQKGILVANNFGDGVDRKKTKRRTLLPIMIKQYEDILEVECRNYTVYDKRFFGEKKIRIIW